MRKAFVRVRQSMARHRGATTIVLSFVAHALLWLLLLAWMRPPPLPHGAVEMTLLDLPPPSSGALGPGGGSPAATKLAQAPRSRSRATLGHRLRSPVPVAPAPAETAESQPAADVPAIPEDDVRAIGDDRPADASEPGDNRAGDGIGAVAGSGKGNGIGLGGNGYGGDGIDHSRAPGYDRESCIRGLTYPWRAEFLNKEGDVRMRVTLDATGRVRQAQVLRKAGYGFDEAAVESVLRRCHFTAALDRRGKPTAFVIDDYHFYFILEDFRTGAKTTAAQLH